MGEQVILSEGRCVETDQVRAIAQIGADDVAIVRMEAARQHDAVAPGEALGHQHSFGGGGRAVIH